jgi:hypothetical protein
MLDANAGWKALGWLEVSGLAEVKEVVAKKV